MTAPTATILLVEDNPDEEALTVLALDSTSDRCSVAVARDGVEALDYLLGDDRLLPRLVLLDLKLPKIDGLEILRRIRRHERTRLLPIVVLTTSREEHDLIAGYASGANGYVCKPVDFDDFTEAVRRLCGYWMVVNEAAPQVQA